MTQHLRPNQISFWPLDRLKPYARNAKTHDAEQVARIAASMAEFGWTVPCLVAADGELIAGHGRVLAAVQLGLAEAPVIVLDHLTEAQRRAYRIADNRLTELGGWDDALLVEELRGLLAEDFDLGLIGIPEDELNALLYDADDDRAPIGALIVGAGELVYWFTRLASGAGGFGEAMGLLKDVAVEVWDRIKMGASSAGAAATAMFYDLKADAASGMAGAIESVVGFGNTTANTFEGALLAVREIWSRLPDVIGDLVFSAANRMLDGIEAMLNGAIRRIDAFTGNIRDALAAVGIETTFGQIGEISLGDIPNPFAGASADAGTAAAEAFRRAFEDNPLTVPDLGLDAIAAEALATSNTYRQAASDLANGATAPLISWGALRDAVAGTGEEGAAALDEATVSADRLSDAMGRAGGAAGSAGDRIATGWRAVSESLQAYATDALNWGKGLGETLTGAFSGAESAFRSFVETGKFDFKGLVRSILADLAVLSFKRAVLGPIASALSL